MALYGALTERHRSPPSGMGVFRAPWATSLRCHGALDVPTATLRRVSCDAVSAATSLRLFWACSKLGGDLCDLGDFTVICNAATALYEISQRPSGDQRRSGRFCRSQWGRRPVWLGYNWLVCFWRNSIGMNMTKKIVLTLIYIVVKILWS